MKDGWYRIFVNPQAAADLERLHPGMEREKLQKDYYSGKWRKAVLIILTGSALAVFLAVRTAAEKTIDPQNRIARSGAAGTAQELKLETAVGEGREQFKIQIQPLELSEQEAQEQYRQFRGELPALIAGENPSLKEVQQDLCLEESFEGYPFEVEWRSGNVDAVTSEGAVQALDSECSVTLTAEITYGEMMWTETVEVTVLPPSLTEQERLHRELEALLLETERNSRREEYWDLPSVWRGEPITWIRTAENYSVLVLAGAFAAAVMVYFLADRDLHREVEKRKEKMKLEYPDIVHKLALYLGAGLTVRGAFQKIAAEYEQGRKGAGTEKAAYEEMLYTCRELQTGVSEASAYEHFGKRTGLQEYIRLATLLSQNLKKGNSTLLQRLREEADKASMERIQGSRRLGEEASTKLLVPMVMMLAVVMVMVMLPALTSMGA